MSVAVPSHILLYDDHCPLCTFQMKLLTWLDWRDVLKMQPLGDPEAARLTAGIQRAELLEAIHCIASDGTIYRGARAIRFIGLRMPLLVPLALFLYIPGVIWVAECVYQTVSRNRHLLSRLFGCGAACTLLPTREREQDRDADPANAP